MDVSHQMVGPTVPVGNLEPGVLARFIATDFATAWDAMACCSPDHRIGGNFMFARQALAYLELAARTASNWDGSAYLDAFAGFLADRDRRYFTEIPGRVPLPAPTDFSLPASGRSAPDRQLLAAIFDASRHGLAHRYQQTPVDLRDGRQWMTTFTGVEPGHRMQDAGSPARRQDHLGYRVGPNDGRIYLVACPDVLMADLEWAASLAAIFTQSAAPEYLSRPWGPRGRRRPSGPAPPTPYAFASDELLAALDAGGARVPRVAFALIRGGLSA